MTETSEIPCPFVYASGKKCTGMIMQARGYGPPGKIKKYRLWCSEGYDHAGAVSSWQAKERMEFYPDQLPAGVEQKLWDLNLID